MWSTWGASPWEGKSGAEVGIVNRKVARRARAGQTFPLTPGLAVMSIWSTGEQAPATIFGCGDDFIHLKYMRNVHGLRASFISLKILLMTVLSQGIGSLPPFQNLKPSLLQSLPQLASMCTCLR